MSQLILVTGGNGMVASHIKKNTIYVRTQRIHILNEKNM